MVTLWAQTVTALLDSGAGWARRRPITGVPSGVASSDQVREFVHSQGFGAALPLDGRVFMGN